MSSESVDKIVADWNKDRKASKDETWVSKVYCEDGLEVGIKSFKTWIQRVEVNGLKDGGPIDCRVKDANDFLRSFLNYACTRGST